MTARRRAARIPRAKLRRRDSRRGGLQVFFQASNRPVMRASGRSRHPRRRATEKAIPARGCVRPNPRFRLARYCLSRDLSESLRHRAQRMRSGPAVAGMCVCVYSARDANRNIELEAGTVRSSYVLLSRHPRLARRSRLSLSLSPHRLFAPFHLMIPPRTAESRFTR